MISISGRSYEISINYVELLILKLPQTLWNGRGGSISLMHYRVSGTSVRCVGAYCRFLPSMRRVAKSVKFVKFVKSVQLQWGSADFHWGSVQ